MASLGLFLFLSGLPAQSHSDLVKIRVGSCYSSVPSLPWLPSQRKSPSLPHDLRGPTCYELSYCSYCFPPSLCCSHTSLLAVLGALQWDPFRDSAMVALSTYNTLFPISTPQANSLTSCDSLLNATLTLRPSLTTPYKTAHHLLPSPIPALWIPLMLL